MLGLMTGIEVHARSHTGIEVHAKSHTGIKVHVSSHDRCRSTC